MAHLASVTPMPATRRRVMAFQKETIIDFSEVRKCPGGAARANEIMHDLLITCLNK